MKILAIQNTVKKKISDTLTAIEETLKEFQGKTIDFLVLPEMFISPYDINLLKTYQQDDKSKVILWLGDIAKKYNTYVIGGSVPETYNNKLFNTTYIFNRLGKLIKKYRKINLFSIVYPDNTTFNEGDVLSSGDEIGIFDTEFGKMGIMICFDIRYPILANKLMQKGAQIIFVPAAFNTFTGPLHWETTFRARAIDNQLFMIGVSPSSQSFGNYKTYGHSLIVDPLGKVIFSLNESEGLIYSDIDLGDIKKAREAIPIVKNQKSL